MFCAKIELYSESSIIIKGAKCKEKVSENSVLIFRQFNVFQFISVQFNVFRVLKFDLQRVKSNLIRRKISFVWESLRKVPKIWLKLNSYEIFIITKLLPSMLDFGKECVKFRIFAAKTYHFIHYSLKISWNEQKILNHIHQNIKTILILSNQKKKSKLWVILDHFKERDTNNDTLCPKEKLLFLLTRTSLGLLLL